MANEHFNKSSLIQSFSSRSLNFEIRYGGIIVLKIRSSAFILILIMLFSGIVSGSDYNSAAVILLDRIALGEGTSDVAAKEHGIASAYDITYAYGQYNPLDSKPLTEMTIGDVKELQKQMLACQTGSEMPSSAVGKYQLISTTLKEQQKVLGFSDNIRFDAETQELFGLSLLEKRGYREWIDGKISDDQFQKNMAKEWASIADPDTGKSYYGQVVGTTDAQIKEAMAQTKSSLGISHDKQGDTALGLKRTPKKGDRVSINSGFQSNIDGTITDIDNGLICLRQEGDYGDGDLCIGIESIRMLTWID